MCYMSLESCDQEQCVTYDWYSYNPYQGVCATKTMQMDMTIIILFSSQTSYKLQQTACCTIVYMINAM